MVAQRETSVALQVLPGMYAEADISSCVGHRHMSRSRYEAEHSCIGRVLWKILWIYIVPFKAETAHAAT
jgi:hypothetical protein